MNSKLKLFLILLIGSLTFSCGEENNSEENSQQNQNEKAQDERAQNNEDEKSKADEKQGNDEGSDKEKDKPKEEIKEERKLEGLALITGSSDYTSSTVSLLDLKDPENIEMKSDVYKKIHSDAAITAFDNKVFVINRLGMDSLSILNFPGLGLENEYSLHPDKEDGDPAANAYAILSVTKDKAYCLRYGLSDVLVFDLKTGKKISSIDLSLVNGLNSDKNARAVKIEKYGDKVVVMAQNISSDFKTYGNGLLIFLDSVKDQVIDLDGDESNGIDGIELALKNPAGMRIYKNSLFVVADGSYDSNYALIEDEQGIEKINLETMKSEGVILTGDLFDYDPWENLYLLDDDTLLLGNSDYSGNSKIFKYSIQSKKVIEEVSVSNASSMMFDQKSKLYLFITDSAKPGVSVLDSKDINSEMTFYETNLLPRSGAFVYTQEK